MFELIIFLIFLQLSRKTSFRARLPAGKPPLPTPPLPKSPSDLSSSLSAHQQQQLRDNSQPANFSPVTQEPLPRNPRFAQLGKHGLSLFYCRAVKIKIA